MSAGRRPAMRLWALWALAACALAGVLLPSWAASAPPDEEARGSLDRAVRFLQNAQNLDGGFGGRVGSSSDPGFSAWAAYALAAAGINPLDQARPGGVDVYSYLAANTAQLKETTDFDRVALVAIAAGSSPQAFGSVRPVEKMLSRRLPDGSFAQQAGGGQGWVNATAWSIFPLSTIATPAMERTVDEAAEWLLDQQHEDGGWGWGPAASAARTDTDTTGAVIQALSAADLESPAASRAEADAFAYLKTVQGPDGGFRAEPNAPTNSATTAWVIQGIWAAGGDPREWSTAAGPQAAEGSDPLQFLRALQRPDGSIGWTADDDLNSLWMTAMAGPAIAGLPYPLPAVPRAVAAPLREPEPAAAAAAEEQQPSRRPGHGGRQVRGGAGVIAGGGGRGAELFSAPSPQSGGATPHGARDVGGEPEAGATPDPGDRSQPRSRTGGGDPANSGGGQGSGSGETGSGTVEGVLVAAPGTGAAPGLLGADAGGATGVRVALLLMAAMLLAAGWGAHREGRT